MLNLLGGNRRSVICHTLILKELFFELYSNVRWIYPMAVKNNSIVKTQYV